MNPFSKRASAAAFLAATVFVAPSCAGAVPANAEAMKSADTNGVTQAHWVRHRWGWAPGAVFGGIAAGIVGAAIAEGAYGDYYPPYGYYAPYEPYVYAEPGYVYGHGPYWGGPYWRYRHWHRW